MCHWDSWEITVRHFGLEKFGVYKNKGCSGGIYESLGCRVHREKCQNCTNIERIKKNAGYVDVSVIAPRLDTDK